MKKPILLLVAFCLAASIPCANAQTTLANGLLSYWPLNGNANDITPNANNLMVNGNVTYVTGTAGQSQAAMFDGSSAYLSLNYTGVSAGGVDNGLPLYNDDYYTICMWVKGYGSTNAPAASTNAAGATVLSECSSTSGNPVFQLRTDWNGTAAARTNLLSALIEDTGGTVFFGNQTFGNTGKSTLMPFDGNWHHIAWVDSNGVAALYVDGVQDPHVFNQTHLAEAINAVTGGLALDTFAIGATLKAAAPGSYFNGAIQDVAVWQRNLSQTEIKNVMAGQLPGSFAPAAPSFAAAPLGNTNLLAGQSWAMQAYGEGTHPFTYQWYSNNVALADDGVTVFGSQSNILNLVALTAGYSGSYTVAIGNTFDGGKPVMSQPAQVLVSAAAPTPVNIAQSLTNGEISYWPLYTVVNGTVTPDIVGGYDMYLVTPLSATNVVPGKFTNAFQFYGGGPCLTRFFSPGDALPLEQYSNFTVSLWVNAAPQAPGGSGMRFFEMGNEASTTPWVSFANPDSTALGEGSLAPMRAFFRNDGGANNAGNGVGVTTNAIFDSTWHHVTYVQQVVGGALPVLQGLIYIDGNLDPMYTPCSVRVPITANILSIGGTVRNTTSIQSGGSRASLIGSMSDVAVWNRALTAPEIVWLNTNPPPVGTYTAPPPSITSFKPDFAEVASGDSTRLNWIFSASATGATINNSNIISLTTNGIGSITFSNLTASTNYTLIISHGTNYLTNTVSVTVVTGVATGWHILDDFQTYPVGPLLPNLYWQDLNAGCSVVNPADPTTASPTTKNMLLTPSGNQAAIHGLGAFQINPGQANTVFARLFVQDDPAYTTHQSAFGVTERSMKSFSDCGQDTGPIARFYVDAKETSLPGNMAIGAYDNTNGPLNLLPCNLNYQQLYDVWIDVTNGGITTDYSTYTNVNDYFSIWVQREGDPHRIQVISNYHTDRTGGPDFLGPTLPYLNEFVAGDGTSTGNAYLTDVYISKSGYLSTIPVPWTAWPATHAPAFATPTLTFDTTTYPGELNLTWAVGQTGPAAWVGTGGALISTPALGSPWSVVFGSDTNGGYNFQAPFTNTTGAQFFMIWQ